jgi:hypothetical protein
MWVRVVVSIQIQTDQPFSISPYFGFYHCFCGQGGGNSKLSPHSDTLSRFPSQPVFALTCCSSTKRKLVLTMIWLKHWSFGFKQQLLSQTIHRNGQSVNISCNFERYTYNQCLSSLKLCVQIPLMARCTRYNMI